MRRLRHLARALVFMLILLAVSAALLLLVGGLLWLIADILPVWAAFVLVLGILFAVCWWRTGGD